MRKILKSFKFFRNYGKVILNVLVIIIFVIFLVIFALRNNEKSENFAIENNIENMIDINKENDNSEKKDNVEKIKVHVVGFVNNPGLIELEEGSRVNDAIEEAGGITEEGDLSKVNLAYVLSDGEKIYIPSVYDEKMENENSNEDKNSNKVNINSASEIELQRITGIGSSTAKKIIEYRIANGKFSSIEDIKNVSRDRR